MPRHGREPPGDGARSSPAPAPASAPVHRAASPGSRAPTRGRPLPGLGALAGLPLTPPSPAPAGGAGPAPHPPPLSPQADTEPTGGIGRRRPAAVGGGAGRGGAGQGTVGPGPGPGPGRAAGAAEPPLPPPCSEPGAATHNPPRSGQASHSAPRPGATAAVTHRTLRPPLPSSRGQSPARAALPGLSRCAATAGPGPPPPPLPPSLWQPRPPRSRPVNRPAPGDGGPMTARTRGCRPISA